MPKRIGILTYHHVINEGAVLQAYSLSRRLADYFKNDHVEIVDYRPLSIEIRDLRDTLFGVKHPKKIYERVLRYFKFRNFINNQLNLSSEKLITDNYEKVVKFLKDKYDLLIVGSDEIWKVQEGSCVRPFPNIYWLSNKLECKKVAYAASANSLIYRNLSEDKKAWIKKQLSNFDIIGARDDHTMDILTKYEIAPNVKLDKVPDPTFMLSLSQETIAETKVFLESLGVDFNKKLFGITFHEKSINKELFDLYKSQGFQILALSYHNPNADINLAGKLTPIQWAATFTFLSMCFTQLFHGSIFCLKSKIPFLSFDYVVGKGYDTKIHCLLKDFEMLKHYIPFSTKKINNQELIKKVSEVRSQFDAIHVDTKLELMRKKSQQYIEKIGSCLDDRIEK